MLGFLGQIAIKSGGWQIHIKMLEDFSKTQYVSWYIGHWWCKQNIVIFFNSTFVIRGSSAGIEDTLWHSVFHQDSVVIIFLYTQHIILTQQKMPLLYWWEIASLNTNSATAICGQESKSKISHAFWVGGMMLLSSVNHCDMANFLNLWAPVYGSGLEIGKKWSSSM